MLQFCEKKQSKNQLNLQFLGPPKTLENGDFPLAGKNETSRSISKRMRHRATIRKVLP